MVSPWDRAARGYARQEHLEHRAVARALGLAAPRPADRLLDLATGTGLVLHTLARRPDRPRVALGIDASAAMLDRVGALPAGWRTERADAAALPHPDDAFDLVTCSYLLHVLTPADRRRVLAEVRRVLAPEGRLVVVTMASARRGGALLLAGLARAAPATLGGLAPLDPREELRAAGLPPRRAARTLGGYPSLVVLAGA